MKYKEPTKNIILDKSFNFSFRIISLYKLLTAQKEFIISKQILRPGTSIGANVEESTAVQSRKDFLSKITIASKEARETRYWLKFLNKSQDSKINYDLYLNEIDEIIRITTAIVKTSKKKILNSKSLH